MCVCVCVCVWHMCTYAQEGQKSYRWGLWIQLRSSGRAASAPTYWVFSPAPSRTFKCQFSPNHIALSWHLSRILVHFFSSWVWASKVPWHTFTLSTFASPWLLGVGPQALHKVSILPLSQVPTRKLPLNSIFLPHSPEELELGLQIHIFSSLSFLLSFSLFICCIKFLLYSPGWPQAHLCLCLTFLPSSGTGITNTYQQSQNPLYFFYFLGPEFIHSPNI